MAIDLQAKLQETSVNVFQLSTFLEKENLDGELINNSIHYERLNNNFSLDKLTEANASILSEKKLNSFSTSFPKYSDIINEDIIDKTISNPKYEPNNVIDILETEDYFINLKDDVKVIKNKIVKPNWSLKSEHYSFFSLAKSKLEKIKNEKILKENNKKADKSETTIKNIFVPNDKNEARFLKNLYDQNSVKTEFEEKYIETSSEITNNSSVSEVSALVNINLENKTTENSVKQISMNELEEIKESLKLDSENKLKLIGKYTFYNYSNYNYYYF